ncbi:N-acetyltransferase [Campylobacter sp. MIT 99-7217]|uniref:GNAT family N-acetyltransferase n=1 Tax=Campylobacter sp. MIT 99-7217 TaxID=535091 RepID=UPI00115B003E|nr:N-acetyltransferase [Campylobacter sp. MIT 99-7217]TQR33866.1 N-acetyltransferase [Campylobacter sp. MIT 99-7217]
MSFESFKAAFKKGFLVQNSLESLANLEEGLREKRFILKQSGDNFFFFHQGLKLLDFFVNDLKDFKLKPCFIKLVSRSDFSKFEPFLSANSFKFKESFRQMRLENKNLSLKEFDFLSLAEPKQAEEILNFFEPFFNPLYLFYFSKKHLAKKAENKEIILYKEEGLIKAGLIFSSFLNSASLDFIAVKKDLRHKNVAFALMNALCLSNKKSPFFQLFVRSDNERAIKFYERFGFSFAKTELKFYEKEKE